MPPRRLRARIGDSRCHQYRPPAIENVMCSRTCTTECSSAASYIAGTCQIHITATYSAIAKTGCASGPTALLEAHQPARRRAQDDLRQAEQDEDRREVDQQQVLRHVHEEQLLGEPVDRRDERDQDERHAAEEARQARDRAVDLAPATHVDDRQQRDHENRSRYERPRRVGRRG